MKKSISLILTLVFVIGACLSAPFTFEVNAAGVNDLTFKLNSDGVSYSVTDCNSNASGAIEIPSTYNDLPVTSIGYAAFENCQALSTINIPDGVISIGNSAFYNCRALTDITIPDSVTSIGSRAFYVCSSLKSIYVGIENNYYTSKDGILFNKSETELITYPAGKTQETYTFPDSVTSIGSWAFTGCRLLTSITIPDSITSIGDSAFNNCSSLTSITIPDSVASIGSNAFTGCKLLTNITIPDSITSVESMTFAYCESLTSITIPDSVTRISDDAFYSCYSLKSINVGIENNYYTSKDGILFNKSETELITYPAGKTQETYTFPDSVTSIGRSAFYGCYSLTSITIPDSITSIGDYAFRYCTSLTNAIIPDSITSIGDSIFADCTSLANITIPDSVTSIGNDVFEDCTSLTSITIPKSITRIVSNAFHNCTALTNITIDDGASGFRSELFKDTAYYNNETNWENGVLYIGNYLIKAKEDISGACLIKQGAKYIVDAAFSCCATLTNVTISESVTSIGELAFYECSLLTSITIPDTVISIGGAAFYNSAYYNDESNWENGVLYIGNHLIKANENIPETCTIKQGTKTIAEYAFSDCSSLTDLVLPGSLLSIGEYSFSACRKLKYVFYLGSQEDWETINLNDFPSLPIHYNTTEHSHFMTFSSALNELLDICPVCSFENYSEALTWVDDYTTVTDTKDVIIDTTNQYIIVNPSTAAYLKGKTISFYDYKFDITANSAYGFLGTGTEFKLYNSKNTLISEYTAVVRGDVNGDSVCDVLDCMLIELARTGNTEISDIHKIAGDFNINDNIDENDFQSIINLALA